MELSFFILIILIIFFVGEYRLKNIQNKLNKEQQETSGLRATLIEKENWILQLNNQFQSLEKESSDLKNETDSAKSELIRVSTQKSSIEEQFKNHKEDLDNLVSKVSSRFNELSQITLDNKTKVFQEKAKTDIESLLSPFKKEINSLQKDINDSFKNDLKERSEFKASLQEQVKNISNHSNTMLNTAGNLTKALRGDKKAQGNWGELQLKTILESVGLREKFEFSINETYTNHDQEKRIPDVIINLPNNRKIIVDSKVSLNAYYNYIQNENTSESNVDQKLILLEIVSNIRDHIKNLNSKEYASLPNLNSHDFVIMFIPIESLVGLVFQNFPKENENLFEFAFKKGVVIATPTTLIPILKTIDMCWKAENQKNNATTMINKVLNIYDKFASIIEVLEKIGGHIRKIDVAYDDLMKKTRDGKGNLIKQFEDLKKLGLNPKKPLPDHFDGLEEPIVKIASIDQLIESEICNDSNLFDEEPITK